MVRGEYKIATQSGVRGYFGKVVVEVEQPGQAAEIVIDFDRDQASQWQSGARFGIDYVLEHIPRRKIFPQGARIHVRAIEGHEVDTNNTLIAYIAANALLQALNLSPLKRPGLDEATGIIQFPK